MLKITSNNNFSTVQPISTNSTLTDLVRQVGLDENKTVKNLRSSFQRATGEFLKKLPPDKNFLTVLTIFSNIVPIHSGRHVEKCGKSKMSKFNCGEQSGNVHRKLPWIITF